MLVMLTVHFEMEHRQFEDSLGIDGIRKDRNGALISASDLLKQQVAVLSSEFVIVWEICRADKEVAPSCAVSNIWSALREQVVAQTCQR